MRVVYLACPLSPIVGETREGNIARAKAIYREVCLANPDVLFLCGWILNAEVFEETPDYRAVGMLRNFTAIELCHELWMRGPRVSHGMDEEAGFATNLGVIVHDLTDRMLLDRRAEIA